MNTVFLKHYDAPPVNKREVLRYAGTKKTSPEVDALAEECLSECEGKLTYRVCYTQLPVRVSGDVVDFSHTKVVSAALAKNLSGCKKVILFAATIGIEMDRLLGRYTSLSPSKALLFQAIGAERIEALCDAFCRDIKAEFAHTRPRFSPGYGDLSIEFQREMFRLLDCPRKIGLSLNESLLMSPSKSVTAIIGISEKEEDCQKHSCETCTLTECTFRK